MSLYEQLAPEMHRMVDSILGDTIEYRRAAAWTGPEGEAVAGGAWAPITGFVLDLNASIDQLDGLDELDQRTRIKISTQVIAAPQDSDRVRAARLGPGTFKPSSKFDLMGSYWIADVQRAAA